jgi:ligand-binding sensor domain-containing protein/serine phosphatase RsbU (regulator of sigma subunit)
LATVRTHPWLGAVVIAGLQGWSSPASAQVAIAEVKERVSDANSLYPTLRFDRVTGMTKGAVTAIVQDRHGLIWFGTEEGLSRYDGYEFVNYTQGSSDATLSNFTVTSLATADDAVWIGTEKGGLNRLDLNTKQIKQYRANTPQNPIASDYVTALHLGGKTKLLWIGTADAGLDSLDPATGEIKHRRSSNAPESLGDDAVSVVYEDRDGRVWVGTVEAGLDRLDPKTNKFNHYLHDPEGAASLSSDEVTAIFQDHTGTVWIGTKDGLNRYDPETNKFKRYFNSKDPKAGGTVITTITEGADGGLWLGIKDVGVYRFDPGTNAIEKYSNNSSDPTTIIHPWPSVAFSDRGGVLWFGFHAGNVSKLYLLRRDFAFYRTNPGMSFLEQGDRVWLGTQGHGLRSLNLRTGEVKSYLDDELSKTWTMKIIAAEPGSLWLGTLDRGLFHYTPETGLLDNYDTESGLLKSNRVFALLVDGDALWIGTWGAGLVRFDPAAKARRNFTHVENDTGTLSSDSISALHQDRTRPDILWVGTSEGLNELDKRSGRVIRYIHDIANPTSISHDYVTAIHEDAAGRLWIATWGGGLNLFDRATKKFTAVRVAQGLASDTVLGILEDKSGALWLTTNDGLTEYVPGSQKATSFRSGDGLQADEFAQGGFHQGASGRFYVGGPLGFNVFIPEKLKGDTYVPPLVITKFELLGEPKAIPEAVSLGFRDRWFSVTFASLAYGSPERNRYKFRLRGFDDWVETDRRYVNYSNLPPGDYELEILGSNAHGVWNDRGIKIPIHVKPPPWRTWWAYAGYCVLVAMIIGLFVRRQRRQLNTLRQAHRLSELEREIELTSAVQEGFFPAQSSVSDGVLRLEGFYRAATQCSGDWWWYEGRGDTYFILVGDVTGHGAGSAMVTAAAASCFRSLGTRVDDDQRLAEMNDEVLRVSRGQYHMTLTAITINVSTGEFVIRSAGGVPVFALPPEGRPRVHMCPGMPLGSPDFQVGRLTGRLQPGERILILTDGIPEVAITNAQLLGPRGVSNFYMQTRDQELRDALQQLIKKVEAVQEGPQDDDWTAVMVQWGTGAPVMALREEDRSTVVTRRAG